MSSFLLQVQIPSFGTASPRMEEEVPVLKGTMGDEEVQATKTFEDEFQNSEGNVELGLE